MTPEIIITDPQPLPKDGSCPQCGAPERYQMSIETFGRTPFTACSRCGYEFPE